MSCPYQEQIRHNRKFHELNVSNFPDDFFDWKVTCLFYIALHYIKALGNKRKINIGESHGEIRSNINPTHRSGKQKMPIGKGAYQLYDLLYESSRNARYPGITNQGLFKAMMEETHNASMAALKSLILYCESQGLTVESAPPAKESDKVEVVA